MNHYIFHSTLTSIHLIFLFVLPHLRAALGRGDLDSMLITPARNVFSKTLLQAAGIMHDRIE